MSDADLPPTVGLNADRCEVAAFDHLVDISAVVRRVVSARVADQAVVEDLTQETLVRVAGAQRKLAPEAMQAYAIVTARHLVVNYAHSESVHRQHQHRLVDYTTLDGPEQLTLQREETDALAAALDTLDGDDRALLVRHESDGVPTDVLADEAGVSAGAIGMRLARARATLRLEFVLAFRRVTLPTTRCRQILLACSAGDRRRQHTLGAAGHLLRCPTCASLARPVTERRRGIAVWLLIPVAEAVRRAARSLRHNHLAQAATAVVATAAIAAGVVITQREDPSQVAPAPSTVRPAAATAETVTTSGPTAPATTAVGTVTPGVTTAASPACPPAVPLDQTAPGAPLGCPFAPTTLTVIDVPADEGFWARDAASREVWVQLVGDGESPVEIVSGSTLTVVGTISDPEGIGSTTTDARIQAAPYVALVAYTDVQVS